MKDEKHQQIELEDFHEDILAKAMRGLSMGKGELAERLGIERSRIEEVLDGSMDEEPIKGMADSLKLDGQKLLLSARREWNPAPLEVAGLKQFNLPFGPMLVNAYVVWSKESKQAWIFDTGPTAEPILDFLTHESLSLDSIFVTHTHPDHIACLEELKQKTGNPQVFVHALEAIEDANLIEEGFNHNLGYLKLRSLHTLLLS